MDPREAALKAELDELVVRRRSEHAEYQAEQARKRQSFQAGMTAMLGGNSAGAATHLSAFDSDVLAGRQRVVDTLTRPAGFINGTLFFEGQPYTGTLDGVTFVAGVSHSGFVARGRELWHDGRQFTGTWEGVRFVDGLNVDGRPRPERFHRLSPMGERA